jgi:hypothetical protein
MAHPKRLAERIDINTEGAGLRHVIAPPLPKD